MGKVTVFCIISGCTPEIADNLRYLNSYGPVVTSALEALADPHELSSQDDLCVIAPVHPSGQPYVEGGILANAEPYPLACDVHPETEIHVVSHCVSGDSWDFGFVDGPPPNEEDWRYLVSYGCGLMVQTHALDIMALATRGCMTPLRLWRLAMQQGFEELGRPYCLEGVEYGEITDQWEQIPNEFPRFTEEEIMELEEIGDVESVKRRLVHEGFFWVWMAPDRFPISKTKSEYPKPFFPEVYQCKSRSAIETLPAEVLIHIVSSLPLSSLLNLVSTSRSLRTGILRDDYVVCAWIYNSAPWWIPVRTRTHREDEQTQPPTACLASKWPPQTQTTVDFPTGLDWAYVWRCIGSGSMRNRRRIWNVALDIERLADLEGV